VVDSDLSPTFNVSYMLTDHISTELMAAWPFTNGIDLKTSGGGKERIGSVDVLPPILSLNWHFNPNGVFRPYIGAGVNYTLFSGEETRGRLAGNSLKLDDSVGVAGQVGVDIGVTKNFFLNLNARYVDMSSDAEVNGADVGTLDLNPWILGVHVGYRFGKPHRSRPLRRRLRSLRPRRRRLPSRSAATPTTTAFVTPPTSAPARRLA
jgi:outer membrane protein